MGPRLVRTLAGVALGAALLAPAACPAQPIERPSPEARAAFNEAVRHFDSGDYPAALEGFRRAWELSHRNAVLLNIGVTCLRARRPTEAVEALQRFLDTTPPPPASQRGVAEQALSEARTMEREIAAATPPPTPPTPPPPPPPPPSGTLVLRGVPAGGVVTLDGRAASASGELRVDPGPHSLAVEHPGSLAWTGSLSVPAGETVEARVRLSPRVVVRTDPWRLPLTVVAAALGLTAVGLGVGALSIHSDFEGRRQDDPEAQGLASRGQSVSIAADVVGVVALITGGLAAWRWLTPAPPPPPPSTVELVPVPAVR